MPALNDHPKYVTAKQAASIVGKTQATIYNWRKRGHFDVHHTDEKREWAYDRDSHIGRLDKALGEAAERGWIVVDMKKDWNRILPFER